jgi:hypothetical protein
MKLLNKEERSQVREAARGMNAADAANFESAVVARLQELLDSGVVPNSVVPNITRNHIRAACSQGLVAGK